MTLSWTQIILGLLAVISLTVGLTLLVVARYVPEPTLPQPGPPPVIHLAGGTS